jgi:acyl-CoA synthetase (AMP-forming)/AMP-acid ligase II
MLYTSPRNSVQGDLAVIEAAQCHRWLVPSSGSNISRLMGRVALETFALPNLGHFLDDPDAEHIPFDYPVTWQDGRTSPCWVLHTSGSTGNPKPVVRFQDSVASTEAARLLPAVDGKKLLLHEYIDSRVYLTFPLFHVSPTRFLLSKYALNRRPLSVCWSLRWHAMATVLGDDCHLGA